ncbi:protein rapunzel-like [Hemitrygon akajei]|uniref:protein rapunzel-like n=1 Tax=Hemitrygon akajei TaxID=2704970 RepID=UPI003BF99FDE
MSSEDALEMAKATAEVAAAAALVVQTMDVLQSAEKWAAGLGVLGPVIGVASLIVKLALGNQDSPEMAFMKEEFQAVRQHLDMITEQVSEVLREIERSTVNNQYFPIEENIKSQFRKYIDILDAKEEYREKEKEEFLKHFDSTKGDQNLYTLYDGVMGASAIFGKSILDTAMNFDQRNRRLMESLCARLNDLFCIGLIAVLGHAGITGNDAKTLEDEWNEKLEKMKNRMQEMVDRCINEFAEQAEIEIKNLVKKRGKKYHVDCTTYLLDHLKKKYNWVWWAVRVYDPLAGSDAHYVLGRNHFTIFGVSNMNVVISYSTNPKPIDSTHIVNLMKGKDGWNDAKAVAEHIFKNLGSEHLVHTVKRFSALWEINTLGPRYYFFKTYGGVTLCVHTP